MKKILTAVLLFLFASTHIAYCSDVSMTFDLDEFGLLPTAEMLCFRGPCLDEYSDIFQSEEHIAVSSYLKPVDMTIFGEVPISSPKYDFYNNHQIQISFDVLCDFELTNSCLDYVEAELVNNYGMTVLGSDRRNIVEGSTWQHTEFENGQGVLAKVIWAKHGEEWSDPFVKIYDKDLMDELRSDFNPYYVASE